MVQGGKVVNNRSLGGVPAQQFEVRLGKKTTVPITLGFTKSNELFVGRLAMLGVFLACDYLSVLFVCAFFDFPSSFSWTEGCPLLAVVVSSRVRFFLESTWKGVSSLPCKALDV
jgi:hypothetical protein